MVIRYPGSMHDARIFDNSSMRVRFESGELNGLLLGDSAYPCREYILTPLGNPTNDSQERYNASHIRTRNTVERAFGIWKAKFPCLRGLTNNLRNVSAIIAATATLHNISRANNEPDFDFDDADEPDDSEGHDNVLRDQAENRGGVRFRRIFIERNFS